MSGYQLLLPSGLLEKMTLQKKPHQDHVALTIEYVLSLLSRIGYEDGEYESAELSINAKKLRDRAGKRNKKTTGMTLLEGCQAVKLVRNYFSDHHPRQYQWTWPLLGKPTHYELKTKHARKRFDKSQEEIRQDDLTKLAEKKEKMTDDARLQVELIESGRLKLDITICPSSLEQVNQRRDSVICWRRAQDVMNRRVWAKQDVELREGGWKHFRLHTTVTSLKREFRQSLLLDDRPVAEVDVSCCNPVILASIMRDELQHESDYARYRDLCEQSRLYEELASAVGMTRDRAKVQFQTYLNDPKITQSNKTSREFKKQFPSVADWIEYNKTPPNEKKIYEICTVRESAIMLRLAAQFIQSGIPAVTVHDSIVVPRDRAEETQVSICDAFDAGLNIRPTVKIKT